MKKKRNFLNVWKFLVLSISIFCLLFACSKEKKCQTKIYIAGNLPLTGPIAIFSGKYPLGFKLGIEDACKKLHINKNIFDIDFEDNEGKPVMAAHVMRKQLLNNPQIYISGTSQMSEAIVPEIAQKNIPHFLVSFDTLLNKKYSDTITILPNFKLEAPLFLKFIIENKAKKVFFFTPNLKAYLYQFKYFILPEIKRRKIQYKQVLFDFHQKEFRNLVIKAVNYKPDVIIVSGYAFHVYPIIKLLKQYDMDKKSRIMATLDYIDLLHNLKNKQEISGIAFTSPLCEIPGKVKSFKVWEKRFKDIYGKVPSYVDAYGYDTARIIVTAYKKYGKVSLDSILKTLPFKGVVGTITVDRFRVLNSTLTIGFFSEKGKVIEWSPKVYLGQKFYKRVNLTGSVH